MLKLSIIWEGSIVSWVAFLGVLRTGVLELKTSTILQSLGVQYMLVIIIEPLIDLAVLSAVKALNSGECNILFDKRLNNCKA